MSKINQIKPTPESEPYDIEFKTGSYDNLNNQPSVNGVTLSGDKSTQDLIPLGRGLEYGANGELQITYAEAQNVGGGTTVTIG